MTYHNPHLRKAYEQTTLHIDFIPHKILAEYSIVYLYNGTSPEPQLRKYIHLALQQDLNSIDKNLPKMISDYIIMASTGLVRSPNDFLYLPSHQPQSDIEYSLLFQYSLFMKYFEHIVYPSLFSQQSTANTPTPLPTYSPLLLRLKSCEHLITHTYVRIQETVYNPQKHQLQLHAQIVYQK